MGSRRQSVSGVTQNIIMKKYTLIMFALMAVTACVVGSPQRKKISVKAPSPFENYDASVTTTHGRTLMERSREIARALTQPAVGGVMSDLEILAMTYNTPRIEEIVMVS